eukprot:PITA_31189
MLYRRGVDTILRRCLTHEKAEKALNECHSSVCDGHLSRYATVQRILHAGYFRPTIFKNCIIAVRSCHACQTYDQKTRLPPAPLHPVITIGPFAKWGIDFMTCNPTLAGGHGYIIVVIDYFTKWAEVMPTLNNGGEMAALFFFNLVVAKFGVPQAIVTDHGSYFHNHMMSELTAILSIQCEISSLKLAIDLLPHTSEEEARFLELIHLNETHRDAALANEAHKKHIKAHYDRNVKPHVFLEGDLILLYDQDSDKLGAGKFEPLWMGPYIVKLILMKGSYELVDYDGIPLLQP